MEIISEQQEAAMHDHKGLEPRPAQEIHQIWRELVAKPGVFTDLAKAGRAKLVMFAAGGGLPQQFGNSESNIWKGIEAAAQGGMVKIAGVEFAITDLAQMGEFYQSLREEGLNFHCIDERLVEDDSCLTNQVHEGCGACNATGSTTGLQGVEDMLLGELSEQDLGKQGIYPDMHAHTSIVISVDFTGGNVVLGEERQALKDGQALPFNISIPLDKVAAFASKKGVDAEKLVQSLVKWNVQIARNIIGGDHNTLQAQANDTLLIAHARGVGNQSLVDSALQYLNGVQHKEILKA